MQPLLVLFTFCQLEIVAGETASTGSLGGVAQRSMSARTGILTLRRDWGRYGCHGGWYRRYRLTWWRLTAAVEPSGNRWTSPLE